MENLLFVLPVMAVVAGLYVGNLLRNRVLADEADVRNKYRQELAKSFFDLSKRLLHYPDSKIESAVLDYLHRRLSSGLPMYTGDVLQATAYAKNTKDGRLVAPVPYPQTISDAAVTELLKKTEPLTVYKEETTTFKAPPKKSKKSGGKKTAKSKK